MTKLSWRGETLEVDLEARSNAPLGGGLAIWKPGVYPLETRERWIADLWLNGHGCCVEAEGETAQDALDALAVVVPMPLVRGGSC